MINCKAYILFLFCLSIFHVNSQNNKLENFNGISSTGNLPDDFLKLASEKAESEYVENNSEGLKKDFFIKSSFSITNDYLLSGLVLYNDPLSNYVNRVAENLLKDSPKIKERLTFYVLKTNVVNAFSTDLGLVFVTVGLLAHLENEAQLAYILAHEISHFQSNHIKKGYIHNQAVLKNNKRIKTSVYDLIKNMSRYSQKHEFDADQSGFYLFKTTDYDLHEAITALEMLRNADQSYNSIPFDKTYFNSELMYVPTELFSYQGKSVTVNTIVFDSLNTHPNINSRISKIEHLVKLKKRENHNNKFIVSENDFYIVRNLSRFELIRINLSQRKYIESIYDVFCLKKQFPNNKFLVISEMKALYGLLKYKNHNRFDEVVEDKDLVEGELYLLHHFISSLTKEQLNVLVLRRIIDLKSKISNLDLYNKYHDDIIQEFANNSKIILSKLSDTIYTINNTVLKKDSINISDSIIKIEASNLSPMMKIKRIKQLKAGVRNLTSDEKSKVDDFHYFALSDLVKSKDFISKLESIKYSPRTTDDSQLMWNNFYPKRQKKYSDFKGVNNMNIMAPKVYIRTDRKRELRQEKKEGAISEYYQSDYKGVDIKRTVINNKSFKKSDDKLYYNLGVINTWFREFITHDGLSMINSTYENMIPINSSLGSNNYLFSVLVKIRDPIYFSDTEVILMFGVLTIPLIIGAEFIDKNHIYNFLIMIDAEENKVIYEKGAHMSIKERDKNLKFMIYHTLKELSK